MNLKRLLLMLMGAVFLGQGIGEGAQYKLDPAHSEVGFKIRHLVSKTRGRFDDFSGTFEYKSKKPSSLSVEVTIKTTSINTHNEKRDNHLRGKDFFHVEKFPEMTFKSKKAKKKGSNRIELTGDLTLLGVTKRVILDVELLGEAPDAFGKANRIGFTAIGKINRKDFGMEYNITDKGGLVIGNEIEILIEVEGVEE